MLQRWIAGGVAIACLPGLLWAEELARQAGGAPVPGARVVVLYIDGLRDDVLAELAAAGQLPHLRAAVLDRGTRYPNAFTVFPSNTLITNGSLFTGRWSDGTGIKSQNQFERSSGPTAETDDPVDDVRILDLLDKFAPAKTYRFLKRHNVPTLFDLLPGQVGYTTLPIAPLHPPPRWMHAAVNAVPHPWWSATLIPQQLDRINAAYAAEELVGRPELSVLVVWFPGVDKLCHTTARGQFGPARRVLIEIDQAVGRIVRRLKEVGWYDRSYLILLSDHGHLGGRDWINQHGDLIQELLHRRLGVNVRTTDERWERHGTDPEAYVFVDAQGQGQAKLFLPFGGIHSHDWRRRNHLAQLTAYDAGPNRGKVNLLEELLRFRPRAGNRSPGLVPDRPVDLVLVKLSDHEVLVMRDAQNQAVIRTVVDEAGTVRYAYRPSHHPDPLGYAQDPGFGAPFAAWSAEAHTAEEWLQVTHRTRYPDAVVAMARFFAWRPALAALAPARDPDVVVTAAPGWAFRSSAVEATDHGYPLAESMRIVLRIAGPQVRATIDPAPHRIIDVLPTILEMVGRPELAAGMDGRPIRSCYAP